MPIELDFNILPCSYSCIEEKRTCFIDGILHKREEKAKRSKSRKVLCQTHLSSCLGFTRQTLWPLPIISIPKLRHLKVVRSICLLCCSPKEMLAIQCPYIKRLFLEVTGWSGKCEWLPVTCWDLELLGWLNENKISADVVYRFLSLEKVLSLPGAWKLAGV